MGRYDNPRYKNQDLLYEQTGQTSMTLQQIMSKFTNPLIKLNKIHSQGDKQLTLQSQPCLNAHYSIYTAYNVISGEDNQIYLISENVIKYPTFFLEIRHSFRLMNFRIKSSMQQGQKRNLINDTFQICCNSIMINHPHAIVSSEVVDVCEM